MGGWLTSLAERCRLPLRGGFAELDLQIDKFRMLRDSYQLQTQDSLYGEIADVIDDRNQLSVQ